MIVSPGSLGAPVGMVAGLGATAFVRALAQRRGWVAQPNPLVPQHRAPVVLLGGIGIVTGFAAALALAAPHEMAARLSGLLPVVGFLALGVVDDLRPLRPLVKLAWQVLLATAAVAAGTRASITGFAPLDAVASGAWIVLLVNAVNVTDVCDGLAAGIAAVGFAALGIGDPALRAIAATLVGACAGFLFFNRPNATIFMGDAGSLSLGYLLAWLSLATVADRGPWPGLLLALAATAVFLFEVLFLIVVRTRKGLAFWRGSTDHFSLRMQAAGLSKWRTVLASWGVAALAVLGASLAAAAPRLATGPLVLASLIATWFAVRWLARHEVR